MNVSNELNGCPICRNTKVKFLYETYDRHYGYLHENFNVYKCNSCGLIFINPMLTAEKLHSIYPTDSYYAYQDFTKQETKKRLILKFFKFLLLGNIHLKIPSDKKGSRILDIGCGSGKFLYEHKKKGFEVYGVEIDKSAVDRGNQLALNIVNGTVDKANFESLFFDIIRLNHSFEHIDNPSETIEEISRIIKKGGKLLIGVPNTKSLTFKLFGKYWFYLTIPFHPFNYNINPIRILLERNGFKITKKNYVGTSLGITGSIQLWLNRKTDKKVNNGFFLNIIFGIIFHQFARLLNILNVGDCIEILAIKE